MGKDVDEDEGDEASTMVKGDLNAEKVEKDLAGLLKESIENPAHPRTGVLTDLIMGAVDRSPILSRMLREADEEVKTHRARINAKATKTGSSPSRHRHGASATKRGKSRASYAENPENGAVIQVRQ